MKKECEFVVSCLNCEKYLNQIASKYDIYNFSKIDEKVIFYCKNKDKKNIEKILKKLNVKIYKNNYFGIFFHIKKFAKIGIILGILFSCILWIISTFFITDILIFGDINFSSNDLYNLLNNYNISRWTKKSNIDTQKLQTEIENIKYISYASVIIRGNMLVINIKEKLVNSEVENLGKYEPLVSLYDAKVTAIKLIQGTAKVKVGDIVKVGDVLVEPYSIDSSGEKVSVQPLADVWCDVFVSASQSVKEKKILEQRTGNKTTSYSLSVFGLEIFSKKSENSFSKFQVEKSEVYVSTLILPIKRKEITVYEVELVEQNINFEQDKQIFIDKSRQIALLNLGKYDIIKDESYTVKKIDDEYTILYTITFNKKIC